MEDTDISIGRAGSVVDLFRLTPDQAEWQALQPRVAWIRSAHPVDVALLVLDAFPPPGLAHETHRSQHQLEQWLLGVGTSTTAYYQVDGELAEALQLLEHSELVIAPLSQRFAWKLTRFGLALRTEGHDAVRRRIRERTGLRSEPPRIEDAVD